MGNPNIQGVIPLAGRGHINRSNGSYSGGEYKQLVNMEINSEGHLVNRRNIEHAGYNSNMMVDPLGFIGHLGAYSVVRCRDALYAFPPATETNSANIQLWAPSAFPTFKVYHCFHYNERNYWIGIDNIDFTANYALKLYSFGTNDPQPAPINAASLTNHGVAFSYGTQEPYFRNAFMFKERLWFATRDKLIFSKATDPTVFTVPDGGFFNFSDVNINSVVAFKDTIYIICDSAVYVLTYTSDPNIDATVRLISNTVGGDGACIYNDVVYFSKHDALYAVTNTSVSKVLDLEVGLQNTGTAVYVKLASFGDYIAILKYSSTYLGDLRITPWRPYGSSDSEDDPTLFFLNMTNGALHAVVFRDQKDDAVMEPGIISDIYFVPWEDTSNQVSVHFMTSNTYDNGARGSVYTMSLKPHDGKYSMVVDKTRQASGGSISAPHDICVEISSYSPEGNEYSMKKFRNLMLMGKFPPDNSLELRVGYDNNPYGEPIPLGTSTGDISNIRSPFPMRFPLNQRAHSLSLKISTIEDASSANTGDTIIEDIRTLWTYTKRGPVSRDQVGKPI